uniref:Thyroglobulin type-1 domain-containing protein n=1 Tax=Sinocyclocheilus rhinocerous TaxID=307959 RepID=A0A673GWB0_9TELE
QAVCGSNGRLYKSLCSFQRAQCINSQLRTAALSTCTALQASARFDSFAIFIPECKSDGTYTEVQCHNQTGYCWCSSPDGMPMSGSSVLHLRPNCTGEFCLGAESTIVHCKTKQDSSPKNENSVINYSPSCCSKPVRPSFIFGTQFKIFLMKSEAAIQGSEERFVPECSADGRYRAVQCHMDSGRPVPGTSARFYLRYLSVCVGCPSVRKAGFLKSLMSPEARPHVLTSPASFSSVQTLHRYFTWLDADTDGLLSEREMRLLRLLLRRTLRPRRCAKKLMQFCDRNADRRLSAQELTSCLGI